MCQEPPIINGWHACSIASIIQVVLDIFLFVLNIVDHKDYNKLFGYKKNC